MMPSLRPLFTQIGVLGLALGALFLTIEFTADGSYETTLPHATSTELSAGAAASIPEAAATSSTSTAATTPPKATSTPIKKTSTKAKNAAAAATPSQPEAKRIRQPYTTPPHAFADVNVTVRAALINILCTANGSLRPISGSGIIIDSRGVILTNAHVAQYVLFSQSKQTSLACYVRTGSPAVARFTPKVLYIPPVWVREHAADITSSHAIGTGEHDYALLYIASSTDGSPLPGAFPSIAPDVREAIGFVDDAVLAASYPAEFIGSLAAQASLYPSTSITEIEQLMTFGTNTVDVISVGGTIQAQAGSSGGAVVNAWNRLIGVITTTSEGATTAERDLRAVTLSYINRDLSMQTGFDLQAILAGDPAAQADDFAEREAPQLIQLLLKQILR